MGLATFLPWSEGAVPWGASAITVLTLKSPSKASSSDSAPAMVPNIWSTISLRQSPSRLSAGMTIASPD
jgi:hypothetical protein